MAPFAPPAANQLLAAPPFRQAWVIQEDGIDVGLGLIDSTYVVQHKGLIRAIELSTGKTLWTRAWDSRSLVRCPSEPGTLYLRIAGTRKKGLRSPRREDAIVELDPKTGKTLQYLRADLVGGSSVAGGKLYFVDRAAKLVVVDIANKHILLSAPVQGVHRPDSIFDPVVTDVSIILSVDEVLERKPGWTIAIDPVTGRELWRRRGYDSWRGFPRFVGNTVVSDAEGLIGLDPKTGYRKWKVDLREQCGSTLTVDGNLVCCFYHSLLELDPKSGQVLWLYRLRSDKEWDLPIDAARWGDSVVVSKEPFAALSLAGKELWRNSEIEGKVLWTNGDVIVTEDIGRILAYRHGERPPTPATALERRRRAIDLCDRLRSLDKTSKKELVNLGEPAFEPLLRASIAVAAEFEKSHEIPDSELLDELPWMLSKLVASRYLPMLDREIRSHPVNRWVGRTLLPALLMAKAGHEKENVSLCLWVLSRQGPTAWPEDESNMALSYLRVCTDPRAKRKVRDWDLKHPKFRG